MVIPNGVGGMDPKQFPRPSEMHEDWFNLVIVGRLELVKGHHLAIDAVASDGMSADVHLHILGAGPREQELQALAKQRGVMQRVHVLGFRRNIYDYIAHCDTLLMPSLHEGLPYTLLEAMALGVPVIASRVGGLAETIQDENTGLLIPPGDVKALAQAIARLRRDAMLRRQLGQNAQHLQRDHYSLEVMTARYLAVYQELLSIAE
jgi:glycosyltransferase involved in cell wall biosynthesis